METFLRIVFYIKKNHRKYHKKFTIALLCLMGLAILIFNIKPAGSATVTFVQKWGVQGSGHGQFENPQGIAVDSSGNAYVADSHNNRIQKFDSSGNYITQWGSPGTGDGNLSAPSDVAVDSSDNVYVVDSGNHRIQKFDSSGNFLTKWGVQGSGDGQFEGPTGIGLDNSGNVYVVDNGNNRVQKFTVFGVYITQWGANGNGNGDFINPYDVAVDPWNNVYVTDTGNTRVEKFDSNGTYLTKWGSAGSQVGEFASASGIAVDSQGNVYVADSSNSRIERFNGLGTGAIVWGDYGSGNSQFYSPYSVAIGPSDHVFTIDFTADRVQEFSISYDFGPYISAADVNTYHGVSSIHAILKVGNRVYLGGVNGLEVIDATNGAKIWWDFNSPINPNTATYSGIFSLAYSEDTQTLYAGTEYGIEGYDLSSSNGTYVWSPEMRMNDNQAGDSAHVRSLVISGSTLYAGGDFDSADTKPRLNLVSFDISTPGGVLTNFVANTDSSIYTMKMGNNNLYLGGAFYSIGGINQPELAEIDLSGSATVSSVFRPQIPQDNSLPYVTALEYYNGNVYVGGSFDKIGSTSLTNLARVDATTGAEDASWDHPATGHVHALAIKDNYLYVGESDQFVQGITDGGAGRAYAYNLLTDQQTDWLPADTQGINAFFADTNTLYVGLIGPLIDGSLQGSKWDLVKNLVLPKPAYADIGGIIGTIYLAIFDQFATTPTVTPAPTTTPTLTLTPTGGPTSTPTLTPILTLTPTPTSTASPTTTSETVTTSTTSSAIGVSPLPPTGPQDQIKVGIAGAFITLIGVLLLAAVIL